MSFEHLSPRSPSRDSGVFATPHREVPSNIYMPDYYPDINCDVLSTSTSAASIGTRAPTDYWRNVIMPVDEPVVKRLVRTAFENGFAEALNEARRPETAASSPWIARMAEYIAKSINFSQECKSKIFPQLKEHTPDSVAKYSETRDWKQAKVRCIVWHPNCFKIAVAGGDDIIRIYTDEPAVTPVLKHGSQKWITSMAWRPLSAAELAVGCKDGLMLWTLDNTCNMNISRTSSQAVFLSHPNHAPINSLQWNPDGTLLATASTADSDVRIWHVDKMQSTPLRRVGPANSLLKWSPDGAYLFSATISNVFRVWSVNDKWTPERWSLKVGSIKSSCWSKCGNILLFITTNDSFLYRLNFNEEQFASETSDKSSLPISDLSKLIINGRTIGGQPQSIDWDPNGVYLAVSFKDSPNIAIFTAVVQGIHLSTTPISCISGSPEEYPVYICFQSKNRKNTDPVLTIGWSTGRIQYAPLNVMAPTQ